MNLLKYALVLVLFFVAGKYLFKDLLSESFSLNVGTHTPGSIKMQVPSIQGISQEPTSSGLLRDLDHDIKQFVNNQKGGCETCYNLVPGSPGANQYNYGVSTECECKGIPEKCGKITTFNQNELAIKDNFEKSTPEVINLRNENWIPRHLISQLHYVGPFDKVEVAAANQNVVESTCYFKSEKTNLAQYFKANPDLYLDTDKYSTFKPYVPFTEEWQKASDCYNNISYAQDNTIPGHFLVNKVH